MPDHEAWLVDLGLVDYGAALELQLAALQARAEGRTPDTLLLLEHPPVITLGRSADPAHVLLPAEELARRSVAVHEVGRGGDVTLHAPGQLVGYPIIDLRVRGRDVHRYLRDLEELLIRALAGWGIQASRAAGATGVWVGDEKVAAIGVGVKRWTTYHGFALNVDLDLRLFDMIVPCGLHDRGVTSIARLLGQAVQAADDPGPQAFRRSGVQEGPSDPESALPPGGTRNARTPERPNARTPGSLVACASSRVAAAWPSVFPTRLREVPAQRWASAIRGDTSSAITTSRKTCTSVGSH